MRSARPTARLLPLMLALCAGACHAGYIDDGFDVNGQSVDGPSVSYPAAAHPPLLQVTSAGGNVMATPALQVVTFNGDANAAQLEDFGSKLAASSFWTQATSEYGVAKLITATPQRAIYTWPTNTTDGDVNGGQSSDVENYLSAQLDSVLPAWGAPNPNVIYALFMPAGINVSPDNGATPSACKANILAWHTAMVLPRTGVTINYMVVPHCGALTSLSVIDSRTFAASHEIITTATNPRLNGFNALDANHAYWTLVGTGAPDVASICVAQQYGSPNLLQKPSDMLYAVQRTWSNNEALEGRAPCVPATASEIFFDAVPRLTSTVSASLTSSTGAATNANTLGVLIASGASAVVPLALFSNGKMPTGWTVAASEVGTQNLTLSLDKTTGNNGDTLNLSITVKAATKSNQELVRITSTSGILSNNEYILVHN